MSEYKCGKCGKEYTFEEYMELGKVKMVEDDPNPMKNYGYTTVCECGYVFHKDQWHLVDNFEIKVMKKKIKGRVSTVFLELNHGFGGKSLWYETMIFLEGDVRCEFMERYETKEEAKRGHARVTKALADKSYTWIPNEWLLSIEIK